MPEMVVITDPKALTEEANGKLSRGERLSGVEQFCLLTDRETRPLRWFHTHGGKELFSVKGEHRHGAVRFLVSDGPSLKSDSFLNSSGIFA